jgi:hypothetical protein
VIPARSDSGPATGPAVDDDTLDWIRAHMAADAALLRRLTKLFADQLLVADADRLCRADPEGGGDRVNRRNGYRTWTFATPAGSVPLAVPRLRRGGYTPRWLLDEPEQAAEAIEDAACRAYVGGVTASAVAGLVIALRIGPFSSSRTAALAAALDAAVAVERDRPLGPGPYPELWLVACAQTTGPSITTTTARIAIASNAEGGREVLGLALTTAGEETGWRRLLRGLVERGLAGVAVVRSDSYPAGLVRAVRAELPAARCEPPVPPKPSTAPQRPPPTIVIRDHGRLRRTPSPPPGRRTRRGRRRVLLLAAVAVLIVAIVLAVMWRTGSGPEAPTGPAPPSTPSTAPTRPPPASTPPTAPSSTAVTAAPSSAPSPAARSLAAPSSTIVTCVGPSTDVRLPWLQQVLCEATAGP